MNIPPIRTFVPICAKDFIFHAEKNIRPDLLTYYQSGATDELTLALNEKAFSRFLFQPRMLCDVSNRNLKTKLLGVEVEHPFGLAPTATHKIAHKDGELATAQAAGKTGTPMILSTLSSVIMEDVAEMYLKNYNKFGSNAPLWFQLYVFKDKELTTRLIKRAEASGFTALVITVDTPISGIRYANLRYRLTFPENITYANLIDHLTLSEEPSDNFFAQVANNFDDSLTWVSMMRYLRSVTKLPIIVKGILTESDAKIAIEHGVQGIVVSNHGGRQLDSVPPTLECLAKISKIVPASVELYMDGGVRTGDDILKAIALGAKMVFIGRPILWALSYGGSDGVVTLIDILTRELDTSLALNGLNDVNNVPLDTVVRASEYHC